MGLSDETRLDDESEALPLQDDLRVELRLEQRAMEAPRWMNAEQRRSFYHQDLIDTFGAEYLSDSLEGQAIAKNFNRSSRKEEVPRVQQCREEGKGQGELF